MEMFQMIRSRLQGAHILLLHPYGAVGRVLLRRIAALRNAQVTKADHIGSFLALALSLGLHWAILAVGQGIFGFGFIVTADAALTYLTDCYPHILGDALIAVVFVRNGPAMVIRFTFTDWVGGMGIQNTFILIGMVALATVIMPILLIFHGKQARVRMAALSRRIHSVLRTYKSELHEPPW